MNCTKRAVLLSFFIADGSPCHRAMHAMVMCLVSSRDFRHTQKCGKRKYHPHCPLVSIYLVVVPQSSHP